jgi:hypothetical protein
LSSSSATLRSAGVSPHASTVCSRPRPGLGAPSARSPATDLAPPSAPRAAPASRPATARPPPPQPQRRRQQGTGDHERLEDHVERDPLLRAVQDRVHFSPSSRGCPIHANWRPSQLLQTRRHPVRDSGLYLLSHRLNTKPYNSIPNDLIRDILQHLPHRLIRDLNHCRRRQGLLECADV